LVVSSLPLVQLRLSPPSSRARTGGASTREATEERALARLLGARASNYSSFSCSAGSQVMEIGTLDAEKKVHRLCVLRDVCVIGNELTYYVDARADAAVPPNMRMSAFSAEGQGLAFAGQLNVGVGYTLTPRVVEGALPAALPVARVDRLYLRADLSYAGNYAHLIMDTIAPAYGAAAELGVPIGALQHVGATNCETMSSADWISHASLERAGVNCEEHFERFYALLMPHPYLFAPARDACYRTMVVGAEAIFSLAGDQLNMRPQLAREMRAALLRATRVDAEPPLTSHHVLVWDKVPVSEKIAFPAMCERVKAWATVLAPAPAPPLRVSCIKPASLPVDEQLRLSATATTVVAEHGSTTYGALFGRPGSSLVVVYADDSPWAKEARTILFLDDIATYFVALSKVSGDAVNHTQGPGLLWQALEGAGIRLNLPPLPPPPPPLPSQTPTQTPMPTPIPSCRSQ
jgi:hypothetical protein